MEEGDETQKYIHLDFRLDQRFMNKKWNLVMYIDIMNIYARKNVWGYSYNGDGTKDDLSIYGLSCGRYYHRILMDFT